MKKLLVGNFTWKRRAARLAAVAVGTVVATALTGGLGHFRPEPLHQKSFLTTTNRHTVVKGPEPYAGMFASALNEAHVPHIDHIRVTVTAPTGCEGSYGCTDHGWNKVYVYKYQSPLQLEVSFLHEMGHQYDDRVMDDRDRQDMEEALGWPRGFPWWDSKGQWGPHGTEWGSPGEVFAEAYAWCAVGVYPGHNRTAYGYQPTYEAWQSTCRAILATD